MKRTLKRSRLLGVLAVLLTMALVTAFGTPVALADGERGKESSKQDCKRERAESGSSNEARDCDEESKRGDKSRGNGSSDAEDGDDSSQGHDNQRSFDERQNASEAKDRNNSKSKNSKSNNGSNDKSDTSAKSDSRSKDKSNNARSNKAKSNNARSNKAKSNNAGSKGRSNAGSSKGNSSKGNAGSQDKSDEGSDNSARQSSGNNGRNSGNDRANGRRNQRDNHPPGNNGTVKIDGVVFSAHPNNEPHPGCVFQVDFYNYEEGDLSATVTFTSHPPTDPSGEVVLSESDIFIGDDAAMGGTDLDATRTYTLDLSGYQPHDQQGHHIKLTVNADGSQGADTKHKVFWVDCVPDSLPDEDEDEVDEDVDDEVEGDRDEDVDRDENPADTEVDEDDVLGTIIQRGAGDAPVDVRGSSEVAAQPQAEPETRSAVLPFTGAGLAAFTLLGLTLIGTGAATVAHRRRTR